MFLRFNLLNRLILQSDFKKVINMTDKDRKLFTEFEPVSTQEWEAKINADLKGKDYERALVWKTYEGIMCGPTTGKKTWKDLIT
jgi:DNA-binding MarR family transcriptional regulator